MIVAWCCYSNRNLLSGLRELSEIFRTRYLASSNNIKLSGTGVESDKKTEETQYK